MIFRDLGKEGLDHSLAETLNSRNLWSLVALNTLAYFLKKVKAPPQIKPKERQYLSHMF